MNKTKGKVALVIGEGARMYAAAMKKEAKHKTAILNIEQVEEHVDIYDMKSSEAVVKVLWDIAEQNNMDVVVAINRDHMKGYFGSMLQNSTRHITTIKSE